MASSSDSNVSLHAADLERSVIGSSSPGTLEQEQNQQGWLPPWWGYRKSLHNQSRSPTTAQQTKRYPPQNGRFESAIFASAEPDGHARFQGSAGGCTPSKQAFNQWTVIVHNNSDVSSSRSRLCTAADFATDQSNNHWPKIVVSSEQRPDLAGHHGILVCL